MLIEDDLIKEFKRRVFEESYNRIIKCLDLLSEEQIWFSPNSNSNSIGNLILHLEGNVRQWMITTFGKKEDKRNRSEEFEIHTFSKEELKSRLTILKTEIEAFIDQIQKEAFTNTFKVQVYDETGLSIFIHVIEHFSYHTGQIALLTKIIGDKDLEFYSYSLE